jgi:hypothetical protein
MNDSFVIPKVYIGSTMVFPVNVDTPYLKTKSFAVSILVRTYCSLNPTGFAINSPILFRLSLYIVVPL